MDGTNDKPDLDEVAKNQSLLFQNHKNIPKNTLFKCKKVMQGTVGKRIDKKVKINLKHDDKTIRVNTYRTHHTYTPTVKK